MRLLVDLQPLQGPSAERGIGYYALALVRALAADRGHHEMVVLLDAERDSEQVLHLRHRLAPLLGRDDVVLFSSPPVASRTAGDRPAELAREAAIAALAPDVVLLSSVFELAPLAPLSVGGLVADVPTAAVLYDLIPLADLALYKADPVLRQEYLAAVKHLAQTDLLLSISDHSADEARRLVRDCPAVKTVHGAAPPPFTARRPRDAPTGGFALAVGRDEPRKDVATAVLAWAGLPTSVRAGRPFVIAGNWPQDNRSRLLARAVAAGLPATDLIFAGAVDDHEMSWLYSHADLFVFPSLVEGLGLPPLEAMQVGTPVLLARASSLVELLDDDRGFFPPGDVGALQERMEQVLSDAVLREELVAAGHRSAVRFTWARTAALTWAALEDLAAPHLPAPRRSLSLVMDGVRPAPTGSGLACAYDLQTVNLASVRRLTAERTVYALPDDGRWDAFADALADAPGVVLLPTDLPVENDLATLLAPAVAIIVPTLTTRTGLLRAGVVSVPILLVGPNGDLAAAVEQAYAGDLGSHWARGAAVEPIPDGTSVARLPGWAVRGRRGSLLASDTTVYRSTPFMSGIQRTAARLHHALTERLVETGGAVVQVRLGDTPPGTPHPDIRRDLVVSTAVVAPSDPDWLLGIDLNSQLATSTAQVQSARAHGVGVAVNVFDLIPHTHPQWFPPGAAVASFTPWLQQVVRIADVLLVNSRATAHELERYVLSAPPRRPDGFAVHLLPLGSDFDEATDVEVGEREPAHFLVVGTVEPRKGHRDVLDAVERLWKAGKPVRLTVLGRKGWMVDDLARRMEALDSGPQPFRWLQNASDAELDRLYRTCTASVVASQGEGFGLPVVEAALRGCPVIIRDLPVLHEVAGDDATCFSEGNPLHVVLDRVVGGAPVGAVPRSSLQSWADVGSELLDVLAGRLPPAACWTPEDGWVWA